MSTFVAKGTNTLRGGVNNYSAKTLEQNWTEDRAGSGFDGGLRSEAKTDYQVRNLEGELCYEPKRY